MFKQLHQCVCEKQMETIEEIRVFVKDGCLIFFVRSPLRSVYICSHALDWSSNRPANPKDLWNFLKGVYWSQFRKASHHLDL